MAIVETYRGYAIDDVGYGPDRYNVNFGGGWAGYWSINDARRAIDRFLPPEPIYFPSDEDVTEAQVIAYQQVHPNESPPVPSVPPLPAPVPLPSGTTTASPTTGAGETGTGALPQCTNDADGLTGWLFRTCQGKPSYIPPAQPPPAQPPPAQPGTTGRTFWDVFSFEDSKSKIGIVLVAAVAFIFLSKR